MKDYRIERWVDGERHFSLPELAGLIGKSGRTLQLHAQQGAIRVQGGPNGRWVKLSEARRYCASRGIDLDVILEQEAARKEEDAIARELESIKQGLRQLAQLIPPRDRPTWLRTALKESGIEREEREHAKFWEQARAVEQRVEFDALAERMRIQQAYDRGER